ERLLQQQSAAELLNLVLLGGAPLDAGLALLIGLLLHRDLLTDEDARRRLSTILESITDAFVSFDQQGRFTFINQKAEAILAKNAMEIIGRPLSSVFAESDGWGSLFQLPTTAGEASTREQRTYERRVSDGRWFEVHL